MLIIRVLTFLLLSSLIFTFPAGVITKIEYAGWQNHIFIELDGKYKYRISVIDYNRSMNKCAFGVNDIVVIEYIGDPSCDNMRIENVDCYEKEKWIGD